ncbi:Biotin--protein ligase [Hypsizygus marmoreus]|uniref:Biotin--protein ligase n=1 Tax=Hypsizygus marmoreus TaxID=39966 RepID=A0A369K1E9_HYPMA|nr:Biotin--protein ligase [Hypsizygus marmoreus]
MNVLIYSGPEALQESAKNALTTIRSLLLPQYSVQSITQQALNSQPWTASCSLLVFPQCRGRLSSPSSAVIKDFVESGGSFLGFGAGAICSQRDPGGASSVSKDMLLTFLDKATGNFVSLTSPQSEETPRSVSLKTLDGQLIEDVQELGLRSFEGFEGVKDLTILARYSGADAARSIAGIQYDIGRGGIAIWAPNLEIPLEEEEAISTLSTAPDLKPQKVEEQRRLELLKTCLHSLAVQLPLPEPKPVSHPLPQFLTSNPAKPSIVSNIVNSIAAPSSGSQLSVFKDENDTFNFHQLTEATRLVSEIRNNTTLSGDPTQWQPKHIILCPCSVPNPDLTPLFDLNLYYKSLSQAREEQGCPQTPEPWGIGEAFLYGEIVTSTQTMLDKNPRLLSRLPTPLVSLASYQLAGRGRGSNIWLSPAGCLQFSVLLRLSLASFPASKLVFIQYLFALAVIEACRDDNVLGKRGNSVRLKWPNDVYAVVDEERKKIGGILVNTSFSGGKVDIVIGCGLNVLNAAPIFSLAQLLPPDDRHNLSIEKTVANILARFEKMWGTFVDERGSFSSFMDLYLNRWLHSDQLVTLTAVSPPKLVRITGITPEHGLLRTVPEKAGWSSGGEEYIDLQPDGNSFDIMAGLIKSKT